MSLADTLKFLNGVRSLLGMRSDDEPAHASEETRQAVHSLLRTPGTRIRLVTATTASDPLSPDVEDPIQQLLAQLNDLEGAEPIATHIHLGQADFFNSISGESRPTVSIDVQMLNWGKARPALTQTLAIQ